MSNNVFTDQELFWLEQEDASSDNEVYIQKGSDITPTVLYDKSILKNESKYQRYNEALFNKHMNELIEAQKSFSQCIDKNLIPAKNNQRKKNYKVVRGRAYLEQNYDKIKSILKHFDDIDIIDTNENSDKNSNKEEGKIKYQNDLMNKFNAILKDRRSEQEKQIYHLTQKHLDEQKRLNMLQRTITSVNLNISDILHDE